MHLFKLIQGKRNRLYYEASPPRDIYECEKCKTKVNATWLQKYPEEICPMDEIENLSLRSDRVCRRADCKDASKEKEGYQYGSCT